MKFLKYAAASLSLVFLLITPGQSYETKSVKMQDGRVKEYAVGHVLVTYKQGRAPKTLQAAGAQMGTRGLKRLAKLGTDLLQVPPGDTVESFILRLQNQPDIQSVEPDIVYRVRFTPNDPQFGTQYYLPLLNFEAAWDITTGISSVVVAVIDTGVNLVHPDIAANLWINTAEQTGTVGVDDDGNGFIDDINGANTIFNDLNSDGDCVDAGETCPNGDPTDDHNQSGGDYHGTHAAGIIAAVTNNSTNIAGVAHNSRVMAVKSLDASGSGFASWIADGIRYAADNGASIINMSLGADFPSSVINSAVQYANVRNVVMVAAAGNTNQLETSCNVEFPAAIDQVMAIGATDRINPNQLASFSCTGPQVDVVAPGVDILSLSTAATTSALDGTSFSAPIVAGIAALLRSLDPAMPVLDVRRYINFKAVDLGTAGFDHSFGFGRVDALASLQAAASQTRFFSNPLDPGQTFAYPNPYTPASGQKVTLSLPASLGSTELQIRIFDVAGRRVRTLTGTNEWDGRNDDGNLAASGIYFYFAKTSNGDIKGKVTVLK